MCRCGCAAGRGRRSEACCQLGRPGSGILPGGGLGLTIWAENHAGLPDESPVEDVLLVVGFGGFAAVGSLLVARRPDNLVSWIMAAIGLIITGSKLYAHLTKQPCQQKVFARLVETSAPSNQQLYHI